MDRGLTNQDFCLIALSIPLITRRLPPTNHWCVTPGDRPRPVTTARPIQSRPSRCFQSASDNFRPSSWERGGSQTTPNRVWSAHPTEVEESLPVRLSQEETAPEWSGLSSGHWRPLLDVVRLQARMRTRTNGDGGPRMVLGA